jgi:putative transposase
MKAVETLVAEAIGVAPACDALVVPRSSYYRRQHPGAGAVAAPAPEAIQLVKGSPRGLCEAEQNRALEVLNSERFADRSPAEVYHTLLDEGIYICSERTMYRLLEKMTKHGRVLERRDQLRHPTYVKPELLATGPNQVWSWDITKLLGPVKWSYFYLYVILDIFSRYVVGWMVALAESAALAERLIRETCEKQGITPRHTMSLHADRGAPMRSKTVAMLLAQLGITAGFSRPYTSDDNPYSEAQFKTLKYWPGFPDRFGGQEDVEEFCRPFFRWYNTEHRHSGIGFMTPEAMHYGRAGMIREVRERTLLAAHQAHPERFVRGVPKAPALPTAAWINPPQKKTESTDAAARADDTMNRAPAEDTATQKCDRSAAGAPHGGCKSGPHLEPNPPVGQSGKLRGPGGSAPSCVDPIPPAQPSTSQEVLQ